MHADAPRSKVALLPGGRGHSGQVESADGTVWSWRAVLADLGAGGPASAVLERAIASVPWNGVFWECAPVVGHDLEAPFRWVVLESMAVERLVADARPFRAPMARAAPGPMATFSNLGGDATLVAPRPGVDGEQDAHLVDFLRTAQSARRRALWRAVAEAANERLMARPHDPMWLSTSGLGVSWLHVRLDDRPKYVTWRPFRSWPAR